MKLLNAQLKREGVAFVSRLLDPTVLLIPFQKMDAQLDVCARDISCSRSAYLSSVSRWASPSKVTESFMDIIALIQTSLEARLNESLNLKKFNVICKNQHACFAIPFHQDISYHKDKSEHYSFTCWLSLSPITHEDGALVCVPRSHLQPIESAVDFWDIDFVDEKAATNQFSEEAISCPASIGDAILFSAKTWHGSFENQTRRDRYALVTRWLTNENKQAYDIPEPICKPFGMWRCYQKTHQILCSLLSLFDIDCEYDDFETIIDKTLLLLPELKWLTDINKAKIALQRVKILNMASILHNAGDSQGFVYKALWHDFLKEVNNQYS